VPVLGHYPVNRPGPVVYAGMEDGEIEIVKRLKQRGLCKGDDWDLYYITDSFILTDPANLAEFRKDVEEKSPSLIVIDSAVEAMGIRDWLNRSEIIEKVAVIRKLAREVCSVLVMDALASQHGSVAAARQPRYQYVRQAIADLGERATVPAIAETIRFSHKLFPTGG
jgi:RecA-family ATPase